MTILKDLAEKAKKVVVDVEHAAANTAMHVVTTTKQTVGEVVNEVVEVVKKHD